MVYEMYLTLNPKSHPKLSLYFPYAYVESENCALYKCMVCLISNL